MAEPVPQGWDLDILRRGNERAREAYRAMFAGVDGAIMMPGATPAHPAYAALQDLLRQGKGRTVHFHWVENGSAYPLAGQPLPGRTVVDAVYQRALLQTDYAALGRVLERFEQALRTGEVRVTSPAGTDLRFRVGTRPVNLQDGDASAARAARGKVLIDREIELPAGAARVAPLEESVEGTIAFPPSQWDGRPVEGLRLHFARGRVDRVEATSGREAVEREMAGAGEAGRAFREFALGFNPLLAVPGAVAMDSVLRLRRRGGALVARRQQRARRHSGRRLRPLELLHGPHGVGERTGVGEGRTHHRAAVGSPEGKPADWWAWRPGSCRYVRSVSDVAAADALTDVSHLAVHRVELAAAGHHPEERRRLGPQPPVLVADTLVHRGRDDVGDEHRAHRRHAQDVRHAALQLNRELR